MIQSTHILWDHYKNTRQCTKLCMSTGQKKAEFGKAWDAAWLVLAGWHGMDRMAWIGWMAWQGQDGMDWLDGMAWTGCIGWMAWLGQDGMDWLDGMAGTGWHVWMTLHLWGVWCLCVTSPTSSTHPV